MICDDCKREKPDVEETVCPFAKEIHEEDVPVKLCVHCYEERMHET